MSHVLPRVASSHHPLDSSVRSCTQVVGRDIDVPFCFTSTNIVVRGLCWWRSRHLAVLQPAWSFFFESHIPEHCRSQFVLVARSPSGCLAALLHPRTLLFTVCNQWHSRHLAVLQHAWSFFFESHIPEHCRSWFVPVAWSPSGCLAALSHPRTLLFAVCRGGI